MNFKCYAPLLFGVFKYRDDNIIYHITIKIIVIMIISKVNCLHFI